MKFVLALVALCTFSTPSSAYLLTASNNDGASVDGNFWNPDSYFDGPNGFSCSYMDDEGVEHNACFAQRSVTLGVGTVQDVNITVRFGHGEFKGEVYLNLQHNGKDLTLIPFGGLRGGDSPSSFEITFDDEASDWFPVCFGTSAEHIEMGCATSGKGTYSVGGLSIFDGMDAAGEWIVTVADADSADGTSLYGFDLFVQACAPLPGGECVPAEGLPASEPMALSLLILTLYAARRLSAQPVSCSRSDGFKVDTNC